MDKSTTKLWGYMWLCLLVGGLFLAPMQSFAHVAEIVVAPIEGQVSLPDGSPLEGATVRVKGSAIGTYTDGDGRFRLDLPGPSGTLVISFIGFKTQEVNVTAGQNITVSLEEDLASLDEVVVVGYGSQVKREITGSVASVSAEDLIKVPNTSVDQALQGMASGVQVASASGIAGAPTRVLIRGTSSISAGTEPLWVVDGMIIDVPVDGGGVRTEGESGQNPLATINPNDIESIDILKDAAATAIYGNRGANGVIIITTKSGQRGKGKLDVSYQTGITQVVAHPEDILITNGNDWLDVVNTARENSGLSPYDVQLGVREDLYPDPEAFTLTEAQARAGQSQYDEILNTGSFHDINLSTSRGTEKASYFISMNYRDERGVLWNDALDEGNRLQRVSARFNLDFKPVKNLTVGTRSTLSYINNRRVRVSGGGPGGNSNLATAGLRAAAFSRPIYPIFDDNGELFDPRSGNNLRATMSSANQRNQRYTYRGLAQIFAQYDLPFVQGLSIRTEANLDFQLDHAIIYGNTVIREESAYAFDDQVTRLNTLLNLTANYTRSFGDHNISATIGTEGQERSFRSKLIEGDALVGTAQEIGAPGNPLRFGGGANTGPNFLSYFGRLNYSFAGKYLVGASFRRDAATQFLRQGVEVVDDTWNSFPGISAGWVLSEEDFFSGASFVDFLKLRASYGRVGNAGIPSNTDVFRFDGWGRYGSRGNNVNAGDLLQQIPAEGITWETTDSWDVGVDFELLGGRISGNIAYFNQDISGLIIQVPIPPSSGLFSSGSIWANAGDMRNSGIEVSVTSYNINTADFRWTTTFNITTNDNEVQGLSSVLDENQNGINAGITTTVTGGMIGEFFLARYAGNNEFGGYPEIYEIDRARFLEDGVTPNPEFGNETGNILPADRNTIRNHKQRTGKSGLPTYFGGINNTLSYKGFELNFNFIFQGGNYIFNNVDRSNSRVGGAGGNFVQALVDDTWTPDNLDATHPKLTWNNRYDTFNEDGTVNRTNQRFDYRGNQFHDQYLEKGDFIRLRTLQVAYNFPQSVLETLRLSGLRVYFTGTNLLTITDYTGLDPEFANLGGGSQSRNLTQGFYNLTVPPTRVLSAGVNLSF